MKYRYSRRIRRAMEQAAKQIENAPETHSYVNAILYNFILQRGCALVWIGYFLGMPTGTRASQVAGVLGIVPASDAHRRFYNELGLLGWKGLDTNMPAADVAANIRRISQEQVP